jgi:excisionase family DNA binding protein
MAGLSLREAAQQAGISKSTVLRAIQSGRLSAARTDDGGYDIQPAELFRVYEPKPSTDAGREAESPEGQDAPLAGTLDTTELRIRNAQLEAQLNALRTIVEVEKQRLDDERKRVEEIKAERDRWAGQAERLALAAPIPVAPALQSQGWWPFRRRA